MFGTPPTGRCRFTAVAALELIIFLLPLGLAGSAAATEIATLAGDELSRVGQSFETAKVTFGRTSKSVDAPASTPAASYFLSADLAYTGPEAEGYSHPWVDDGRWIWGLSLTHPTIPAGSGYFPQFALFRFPRRPFVLRNGTATTAAKPYVYNSERDEDWGIAGKLIPADPKTQWRESGVTHVIVADRMEAGEQYRRFDPRVVEDERAAKLCRIALEPIGTQSIRMLVLSEPADEQHGLWPKQTERMLHVFDYAFRDVRSTPVGLPGYPPQDGWEGVWTKVRSVASPIVERFHTAKHPDGNYLITDEGRLYFTPWKKLAADADLRQIMVRGGELIQYVIHDADRDGRAFAFTTSRWFELKDPLEYHDFDFGTIDIKDPMTTLRCAKELRRHYPAQSRK